MTLRPEQEFLLAVLGNTLNAEAEKPREVQTQYLDWEYIRNQSRTHRIGPLLSQACLSLPAICGNIPPELRQDFQEQYQQSYLHNLLLYQQLDLLLRQLAEIQIVPVLLKGIFLARWVYGNIALRPMQDIDLLLEPQDIERAEQLLLDEGYTYILDHLTFVSDWQRTHETLLFTRLKYQGYHLPTMIKTVGIFQISVELHHHLTPVLDAQQIQAIEIPHTKIPLRTLTPEYFLLHLCFHLHAHAIEGKLPLLIWHYDLLKFLKHCDSCFDWSLLLSLAEQFQGQEIVVTRLAEAYRLFNYSLPEPLRGVTSNAREPSPACLAALFPARKPNPDRQFIASVFKVRRFTTGVRYLWECLFPSRKFLLERYQICHHWLVYAYYLLRLYKAFIRGGKLIKILLTEYARNSKKGR